MRSLAAVDSREISVVIQGPLCRDLSPERNIFACIASIRTYLPHAEIVVSTWPHEDTSTVDADQIIVVNDPGFFIDESGNQININRMLRSTSAGIQAATRPYIMKLRADHNLTSAALAVIGKSEHPAASGLNLFETPITLTTLYIRDPEQMPMLFHISDLVQFGTREAMLKLWGQPLLKEEDVFSSRPSRNPFGNFSGYTSAYRVPEQSLMLGAMHMQGITVQLNSPCQVGITNLKLWDSILTRNFRVLDYQQAGVDFPERFLSNTFSLMTIYTASDIEQLNRLGSMDYPLRLARIWINQYPLSFVRPAWWISLASIILFSISPALAKTVRSYWRKIRKLTHSDSGRI